MEIVHWVQNNWVALGGALVAFDTFLFVVSPLTPWKWDDTLASRLQDVIKKVFNK